MTEESLEPGSIDETPSLQQLIPRQGLQEFVGSLGELVGVPVRLLSAEGALLAGSHDESALFRLLNEHPGGRTALAREVAQLKRLDPASTAETFESFLGASYRVVGVDYDHRRVARVLVGPFLPRPFTVVASTLRAAVPDVPHDELRAHLEKLQVIPEHRLVALDAHLRTSLELLIFSSHKAYLTSQMHLASVSESYRELQDRTTKLQQAYDRLRELDRLKSNFLATVSHELRTPLTSIIGYSEMLAEGIAGPLQGEQLEFVQTIHEKGDQLLQLIKNLLDLSKLESGTLTVRRGPMPIEQVLKQVASTLLPAARKKGVVLEVHTEEGLPPVLGDPERLRQVFLNLTENALKFTPVSGLIRLSARLTQGEEDDGDGVGFALLSAAPDVIEVRVADTGVGIPEKEREKVFDAFYQVDSSSTREVGGTGLGLSIVKRLVEAHEGTIHIEGNTPRGTVVVVELPVASS